MVLAHSRRLIGLTGGIGTGKTTVSRYLADRYQLPVLDADLYAREAVEKGSPILEDIVNRYGKKIQLSDGTLNRKLLGEIVFNNPEEKRWLEDKIHPYVLERFQSKLEQIKSDTVVLVVPLLFEAKMTDIVTEIWVVYCSDREQIRRIINRDRLTETQAIARINSQLPLEQKVADADIALENNSSIESLLEQIDTALLKI
ncbi:MAG: dephospho-CoA kinase [Prochloraceae cyanobacterium]|nr:dephospho-CoA kinase [Prochloraceae cyanobacterium]